MLEDVVSGGNALIGVGEADLEHIVFIGGHVGRGGGGGQHEGAVIVADVGHSDGRAGGGGANQDLQAMVHHGVVGVDGLLAITLIVLLLELELDLGIAGVDLIDGQLRALRHGHAVDGVVAGQGAGGADLEGLDAVAGGGGGGAGIAGIAGVLGAAGGQTEHHRGGHNKGKQFLFHIGSPFHQNEIRFIWGFLRSAGRAEYGVSHTKKRPRHWRSRFTVSNS